jgi:hypothetical protein
MCLPFIFYLTLATRYPTMKRASLQVVEEILFFHASERMRCIFILLYQKLRVNPF